MVNKARVRPAKANKVKPRHVTKARRDFVPNQAPSQWGRRLARAVGEKFGVQMVPNHARNEGTWGNRDIVIKCAKSTMPPVSVLFTTLERIDDVWAVFVMSDGSAEVWSAPVKVVLAYGHHTRPRKNIVPRVEITRRKLAPHAKLLGTMSPEEVAECRIP